jgi:Uma2 family endonuclease
MAAFARKLMSVDEFLDFAEAREGRWELEDGVAYCMAPETFAHGRAKLAIVNALNRAIQRAGLPCEAVIDSVAVRVGPRTAYQPDAHVYCGARMPGEMRETPAPIVVVEVLSPSTRKRDEGKKRIAYFSLPSVAHYLIIDPEKRTVVHHERGEDGRIEPATVRKGALRLDPPGLDLAVEDFFAAGGSDRGSNA